MKDIACITVVLNVLAIIWSAVGVFKKSEKMDGLRFRILQITTVTMLVSSIYFVVTSSVEPMRYSVLLGIQLLAFIAFCSHVKTVRENKFSAVYSKDTPQVLVQHGFYRYIRNPFYLIYLTIYWSLALCLLQPFLLVMSVIMNIIYMDAAGFEEKKFMNSSIRDQYLEYMKKTGRFLPRIFS